MPDQAVTEAMRTLIKHNFEGVSEELLYYFGSEINKKLLEIIAKRQDNA